MLNFITWTCTIKRIDKVWYKKTYVLAHEWIMIDIQPDIGQTLWIDMVKDQYKAYISTTVKDLVKYNDLITDQDGVEYIVQEANYWSWMWNMESNFELTLNLNKTWE